MIASWVPSANIRYRLVGKIQLKYCNMSYSIAAHSQVALGDTMKNWKTMILCAIYLVAMAALYIALSFEVIERDYFYGGIIIGTALVMIVNKTWLLSEPEPE